MTDKSLKRIINTIKQKNLDVGGVLEMLLKYKKYKLITTIINNFIKLNF